MAAARRFPGRLAAAGLLLTALAAPVAARDGAAPGAAAPDEPRYRFGLEVKGHWRSSDAQRFPSPFPFRPEQLPPGQSRIFLETVEPGDHLEVSVVTLWLTARWRDGVDAKIKVDLIDLYDRNPTSEDREVDLDEAWVRFGRESETATVPDRPGIYAKLGKFPKFERQNDRHLESYGLLSTAFNRFEDIGLELGVDLGRHLYVKTSYTQGNPLFFRDPNALAGDNGVEIFRGAVRNPVPERQSGFPIFYDTDADEIDFSNAEFGLGAGVRWESASRWVAVDVLGWGYQRDLADTVDLDGTFYGGDLDLLLGPRNLFPAPITGDEKSETGANVWIYAGDLTFFGQYVDQDLAGLERVGWEAEVSWRVELPYLGSVGGRQLLPFVAPAVRYSELDPRFRAHPQFPAPSVMWDWRKIDLGVRLGVMEGLDVTVEWNDNEFVRAGREESADEFLATVRVRWE